MHATLDHGMKPITTMASSLPFLPSTTRSYHIEVSVLGCASSKSNS
ncbi:MAG: hypothetical protein U0168_31520 [Nannocystaceae bacterium]